MVYMLMVMEMPRASYIIASTMRTGSYLLCEALDYTGVAGHPREIFCFERQRDYLGWWKLPEDVAFEPYLEAARVNSATPNGVFGTKIHWHHLEPLAKAAGIEGEPTRALTELFPGAKYIHLRRKDRRAQAISWYRAETTNQWWVIPGVVDWDLTNKKPEFNAEEIRRREVELDRHQKGWEDFFAANRMEVLEMDYETLDADYRGEVAQALTFIGEDAALAKDLPEPRMARQADAESVEWHRKMDELYSQ